MNKATTQRSNRSVRRRGATALSLSILLATACGAAWAAPHSAPAQIDYLTAPFRQERILDWGERPDWSEDGRRIVFTRDDLTDGPAYEIEVATRKVRCLTCAFGDRKSVTRIFYLPDDSFLIEASPGMTAGSGGASGAMSTELYWMSKSLEKPIPLGSRVMGDIAIDRAPSADHSVRVAWARPKGGGLELVTGRLQLDGRTAKLADIQQVYDYQPGQNSDASFPEAYDFMDGGRSVLFWTVEMKTLNGEMYKVDISTKAVSKVYSTPSHNETHLFPNERYGLEESNSLSDPNGAYRGISSLQQGAVEQMLQMRGVKNAHELAAADSGKGFDIAVVTMDGAARRQLTHVSPSGGQAHQSAVSPDGRRIVFAIRGPNTGAAAYPPGLYVGAFAK